MKKTTTVRTSIKASLIADNMMARINKARTKKNKDELSKSQIIDVAIENLTVQMGIEK